MVKQLLKFILLFIDIVLFVVIINKKNNDIKLSTENEKLLRMKLNNTISEVEQKQSNQLDILKEKQDLQNNLEESKKL